MKYTIFFMLLGILTVSAESYAQKTKLSIDVQNGTLYDVVSEIEKQTGFMFFYKSGDIDAEYSMLLRSLTKIRFLTTKTLFLKGNLSSKVDTQINKPYYLIGPDIKKCKSYLHTIP